MFKKSVGGVCHSVGMIQRLRDRPEWQFFTMLPRASAPLAALWWLLLIVRGLLPALFALAMGQLVGTVQRGGSWPVR